MAQKTIERIPRPKPTFTKLKGKAKIPEPTKTLKRVKEAWTLVDFVVDSPWSKSTSDFMIEASLAESKADVALGSLIWVGVRGMQYKENYSTLLCSMEKLIRRDEFGDCF